MNDEELSFQDIVGVMMRDMAYLYALVMETRRNVTFSLETTSDEALEQWMEDWAHRTEEVLSELARRHDTQADSEERAWSIAREEGL